MLKKYVPYYRRNLNLALPIVLSQLGQVVVQQADVVMVGHLGATELASIAFANAVFTLGMVFTIGFSLGLTPAVGHVSNKTEHRLLAKLLTNAYVINLLVTTFIGLLLYFTSFFFGKMGQDAEVVTLAKPYFYALLLSLLPLSLFFTNKQFAEGLGDTKHAMYITLCANVLNISLNYVLIFGKWGFPELGMLGAGVATLISRIMMGMGFFIIFKSQKIFKPITQFVSLYDFEFVKIKELFTLGFPISIQIVLEVAAFALSGVMAGWLGVIPLAAHQVALSLISMTFMLAIGVGSATTIRVAHYFGEKSWKDLMMVANASIHIILAFMGICGLFFLLFRHQLPHFYATDCNVISLASTLLLSAAIFEIFDGLQLVMISILRGLGDVTRAMWYAFIAYILINLPVGYLLAFTFELGVTGLWIGFIIGLATAGLLFYSRIRTLYGKMINL